MVRDREALAAIFRAIAGIAEVMEMKLKRGHDWPGDAEQALAQIEALVRNAKGAMAK